MTANRKNTARSSARRPVLSDMTRVDTRRLQPHDYVEAPDLADRDVTEGVLEIAGVPARRGRPMKADRKLSTTLRLDPDILAHFKAAGPGWQGRINAALRQNMVETLDRHR